MERKKIEAKDGCDRFRSLTTPGRGNLGWGEENLVGWLKFTYNFSSNFRNCSPNTGPLGLTSADVSVTRRGKSLAPPINFRMGSAPTGPRTHVQKKRKRRSSCSPIDDGDDDFFVGPAGRWVLRNWIVPRADPVCAAAPDGNMQTKAAVAPGTRADAIKREQSTEASKEKKKEKKRKQLEPSRLLGAGVSGKGKVLRRNLSPTADNFLRQRDPGPASQSVKQWLVRGHQVHVQVFQSWARQKVFLFLTTTFCGNAIRAQRVSPFNSGSSEGIKFTCKFSRVGLARKCSSEIQ